jgi:very-short-patch-repair endonuclease
MAFEQILDQLRIPFELEKVFLNGDRATLVDVFLPKHTVAIEIDGKIHEKQRKYDAGRDRWLLETYGVKTIRFTNADVPKGQVKMRLFEIAGRESTSYEAAS